MHTKLPNFCLLDTRRRELGMTYAALAKRSRVSMPTVVRILSGNQAASFGNVVAVAEALGVRIHLAPRIGIRKLRLSRAQEKAKQLVGIVQGTSGLEGQALAKDDLAELTNETADELLAGSRRSLWSD